jgi:3-oxoacyl-[acyl-carrier-protein] synthase II
MKRVVVTGMSGITSLGETAEQIFEQFAQGKSGIRYMPDWEIYPDLRSKLAALWNPLLYPSILTVK